jgi:hypothetical protein
MKKVIPIILVCVLSFPMVQAQKLSLSANYLYLGGEGNHGIGIQSKIHLKNHFYFMPDAGFYFDKYKIRTVTHAGSGGYSTYEHITQFYFINANMAYRVPLIEKIALFPSAGVGFYGKYDQGHSYSSGGGGYYTGSGGYIGYPPVDIVYRDDSNGLLCNLGLSLEYAISKRLFATTGIKYQYAIAEDGKHYFPVINVGIGYNF